MKPVGLTELVPINVVVSLIVSREYAGDTNGFVKFNETVRFCCGPASGV